MEISEVTLSLGVNQSFQKHIRCNYLNSLSPNNCREQPSRSVMNRISYLDMVFTCLRTFRPLLPKSRPGHVTGPVVNRMQ